MYKHLSIRNATFILVILIIILIVLGFYCHIDKAWYDSSLCFLVGILYAQKEEKWNDWMQKEYYLKNIGFVVICGVCFGIFLILGNDSFIGHPILKNIAAVSFCLWVLSILQKVSIEYKVFQWLGKLSYEIFLLHLMWMQIINDYVINKWYYMISVIVLTFISAALMKNVFIKALHKKEKE